MGVRLLTVLLYIVFCSSQFCFTKDAKDSTVCSGQGTCVAQDSCSCYSGYAGLQCEVSLPKSSCVWKTPSQTRVDFPPVLKSLDFVNDNLLVTVSAPLVTGRLNTVAYIQDPSFSQCNYPGLYTSNSLVKESECSNQFKWSLPWSKGKNCGWKKLNTTDSIIYQGNIYLNQKEKIGTLRGQPLLRSITRVYPLELSFKTKILVSTQVKIYSHITTLAAVTVQEYNATKKAGEFYFQTSLQSPFMIDFKRPFYVIQSPNGIIPTLEYIPSFSKCEGDGNCLQTWRLPLNVSTACSLTGLYRVSFKIACHPNATVECPIVITNEGGIPSSLPMLNPLLTTSIQGQNAVVSIQSLIDSNPDKLGRKLVFTGFTPCNLLDSKKYCTHGYEPIINQPNGFITFPSNPYSCKENTLRYCLQVLGDSKTQTCADYTIRYKDCTCYTPSDVVFVVDSSVSISNQNWIREMDFVNNVTKKLIIGTNYVNIGLVQYSQNVKEILPLSSNSTIISQKIDYLKTVHMKSSTATMTGLTQGITTITNGVIPFNGIPRFDVPKVIVLLTDGIANYPCNCASCDCDSCGINGGNCTMCSSCIYYPTQGKFCMPCADPVPLARNINSWRKGVNGKLADWKLVTLGIGTELYLYNEKGMNSVKNMNFDYSQTLKVDWNNIETVTSSLVDQICNI